MRRNDGLRAAVVGWHGGWALALGGLALMAILGGWPLWNTPGLIQLCLVLLVLPGLAGLGLIWRDRDSERWIVLAVWGLATLAALSLTGGPGGAMTGFALMPLCAGLVMGQRRMAVGGGIISVACVLISLVSLQLGGIGPVSPVMIALGLALSAAFGATAVYFAWKSLSEEQAAINATLDNIETLLAGQPGLMLVLGPSGSVRAAYGHPPLGLTVDPLFDQGLIAAVQPTDRLAVLEALEQARAGQPSRVRLTPISHPERSITLLTRALGKDQPPRLVTQAFDSTDQFSREQELDQARAEAVAQSTGKSRFLANMSHELRTPLNAIIGFSDIMRQRLFGPLPDRYSDYADSIHQAGGHLLDMINDVLDVSKIEAERYELSLERFDVRDVISGAIALVGINAREKGVSVEGVLPPEPVWVNADRRAVKQITLNLLSNAIKFTPHDGHVTVALEALAHDLELVVADTGVGIAPEDLKRLGRPYEQAGASDQRVQGTGLGLSLVRSLAELHGGTMSLDSTLGAGAAVTVRLPVVIETPEVARDAS